MLITLGFYKRKQGLTHDEFSTHWREVHGPMIRDNLVMSQYMRRYVQHHIEPSSGFPGMEALDYDGFSEVWFESIEGRQKMRAEPFFQEELLADEAKFIDLAQTRILMFDRQVVQIGEDLGPILFPGFPDRAQSLIQVDQHTT